MLASKKLIVPIDGAGAGAYPYRPKYSNDSGIDGFDHAIYDWDNGTVTAIFFGDHVVLSLIADEPDVIEVVE